MALCAAVTPPAASASTVRDLPSVSSEPLGEFSLSQLLREDALGDECIEEADIDLAFFAAGKGMRLPRTCLPDPCNEALTPFRLAELIGRPAQASEWDRYFSRYADACRKEIVSFDEDAVIEEPPSPAEFWAPILGARVVQGRISPRGGDFERTARRIFGPGFGGGPRVGPPVRFAPPSPPFQDPPREDPEDPGDWPEIGTLAAVPLPMGFWMLITAVGGLLAVKRRP